MTRRALNCRGKPRRVGGQKASHQEKGAALVETAVIAMVLIFLAFGTIEYGDVLYQADGVATAVRSGARQGTSTAAQIPGDAAIIKAMKDDKGNVDPAITRVIVYKATDNPGQPPTDCQIKAIQNVCNSYAPADFNKSDSDLQSSADGNKWLPADRKPGIDYLGVSVVVDHKFITNFFGNKLPYRDYSIMRIDNAGAPTAAASVSSGWETGMTQVIGEGGYNTVPGTVTCSQNCGGSGGSVGGGHGGGGS